MTKTERATKRPEPGNVSAAGAGALEKSQVTHEARPEVTQSVRKTKPRSKSWGSLLFIVCVFALLAAPAVGMLWTRTGALESGDATEFPRLVVKGRFNRAYLSQAGAYFEAHFAGRGVMITADAALQEQAFGVSATDQVVLGRDGWLYYAGDLDDYVGAAPLSDHALSNIAHNLALMQDYAGAQGARFAFAVAPNKMGLYPDQMPARYLKSPLASDAQRLAPYLKQEGVTTVDLFSALAPDAGSLYLKRDSHWNNKGALVANGLLSSTLGISDPVRAGAGTSAGAGAGAGTDADAGAWITRTDHLGDLEKMLHPAAPQPELQYYLPGVNDGPATTGSSWRYTSAARRFDDDLVTTSSEATGTLVMYRDSFGDALLPYLASETGSATFSKLVPYNALQIADEGADFVIVERAERHLAYLGQQPPIMPAPLVALDTTGALQSTGAANTGTSGGRSGAGKTGANGTGANAAAGAFTQDVNGPLTSFSGTLDPGAVPTGAQIYVSLEDATGAQQTYEAFTTSPSGACDSGYLAYVPTQEISPDVRMVRVYVVRQGRLYLVDSISWRP
ncbi:MAG: hypothetical protein FWD65_01495 [Coriobacteriia bacterium]|nr:hypothetical protein [Coriobacteriia bacterium]